jgi:2'-5' RNA ligase
VYKRQEHIKTVLQGAKSFNISLQGIVPAVRFGNYLCLEVVSGQAELTNIHKKLYAEIFGGTNLEYTPHLTVGRFDNAEEFNKAIEATRNIDDRFNMLVEKISVEIIDSNEDSIIEIEYELRNKEITK